MTSLTDSDRAPYGLSHEEAPNAEYDRLPAEVIVRVGSVQINQSCMWRSLGKDALCGWPISAQEGKGGSLWNRLR
jgi:hypothetical protein